MISLIVINRTFAITFGIGLLLVASLVAFVLHQQRGAHLEWRGSVLKVRTAQIDETSTLMIIDFRLSNPAAYPIIVRTIDLEMQAADGTVANGVPIAASDADRMFSYYKLLGPQYNPVMREQDSVAPGASLDRMTAFRLAAPFADVERRKGITLRLGDSSGRVSADLSAH